MSSYPSANLDFESKGSAHVKDRLSSTTAGDKPVVPAYSSLTVSLHRTAGDVILICYLAYVGWCRRRGPRRRQIL